MLCEGTWGHSCYLSLRWSRNKSRTLGVGVGLARQVGFQEERVPQRPCLVGTLWEWGEKPQPPVPNAQLPPTPKSQNSVLLEPEVRFPGRHSYSASEVGGGESRSRQSTENGIRCGGLVYLQLSDTHVRTPRLEVSDPEDVAAGLHSLTTAKPAPVCTAITASAEHHSQASPCVHCDHRVCRAHLQHRVRGPTPFWPL